MSATAPRLFDDDGIFVLGDRHELPPNVLIDLNTLNEPHITRTQLVYTIKTLRG